jgi:hypothetical protein
MGSLEQRDSALGIFSRGELSQTHPLGTICAVEVPGRE